MEVARRREERRDQFVRWRRREGKRRLNGATVRSLREVRCSMRSEGNGKGWMDGDGEINLDLPGF